ncbi:MAG: 4-hydroxy-3-methylbut-2-enyl diphosphate reductase [Candidatus Omnitrophica bacterium]|nr:4-hydroxy-3-methylbut-2-enyl diphosphate reductase [Candidatus Omnitrophota bacterium]MDD5352168.1 4-hydroxy-3-methylbut-2-enyl diphosphate reductase [Candidatus Omnitrophota bacterium]MDD5549766.1 4-hydroxy-3-methylbut-2-enyl diphosphate reductase [Candidatus Omnitrophota bacterium]
MKINVAKSAGFCFGVKRAIDIAYKTLQTENKIYMLGDIVHNEDIANQMLRAGIIKIKHLVRGRDKTLLIQAHGTSKKIFEKAHSLGYIVVDATCPMVKEIHKIVVEMERQGRKIIIIGDNKHQEVSGIIGQLNHKAIVIDSIKHIPFKKIKIIKKAAVVVQSTQNLERTLLIVDILKQYIRDLKFFNTICRPTRTKQQEIKVMPLENDLMIIIGSKTSANTKRLYEICKSFNRRTYWVRSKDNVEPKWFRNVKTVGITAGASTPDYTTQEVIEYIRKLN